MTNPELSTVFVVTWDQNDEFPVGDLEIALLCGLMQRILGLDSETYRHSEDTRSADISADKISDCRGV
jgi:hypothetical protein